MVRPTVDSSSNVMIATPLDPDLVEQIKSGLPDVDVHYAPELLPPPRYPCDHRGAADFLRTQDQERRWQELLSAAEVTFGIPGDDPKELRRLVHNAGPLRFVQGTAAGAGQQVKTAGLSADDLERVAVASSSGVHAGPLAEFALFGILAFTRGAARLHRDRDARRWDHYATPDLPGRTAVILGIGAIGSRIARLSKAFGLYVVGVNRSGSGSADGVDEYAAAEDLPALAGTADVLVITLPSTPETNGMVDATVLRSLPAGAVVVNVGRGDVVDEAALVRLLDEGHLGGAALDVTDEEPPAPESPLWRLPNVILSPHTAALSPHENERIVALFIDNVRRLQSGRPIVNRITAARPY